MRVILLSIKHTGFPLLVAQPFPVEALSELNGHCLNLGIFL